MGLVGPALPISYYKHYALYSFKQIVGPGNVDVTVSLFRLAPNFMGEIYVLLVWESMFAVVQRFNGTFGICIANRRTCSRG